MRRSTMPRKICASLTIAHNKGVRPKGWEGRAVNNGDKVSCEPSRLTAEAFLHACLEALQCDHYQRHRMHDGF